MTMSSRQDRSWTRTGWVSAAVVLLVLGFCGWSAASNWTSTGLNGHEFRQAQTALTVQAMREDGFRLDYSTPVLGRPWAIPMEFPLYQFVVVQVCAVFDLGIAEGGRWVSMSCFLAGLPALVLLLRLAGYTRGGAIIAIVPVVAVPLYIFYSRTVMIEAMAWASAAWFLWAVLSHRRFGGRGRFCFALAAGLIAVLVKPTTWAVFCVPWACVYLRDLGRALRGDRALWNRLVVQGAGIGVPLLIAGFGWIAYADHVKSLNPMAQFLKSSELRNFNFGTTAQRLDPAQWQRLGDHVVEVIMPWWITIPGLLWAFGQRVARRVALLGLAAFVAGPAIFFNLYLTHDYYFYANAAGLMLAVGAGAAACWESGRRWWLAPLPAGAVLATIVTAQFLTYREGLWEEQNHDTTGNYDLVRAIRVLTEPDEVVVVHSEDWSSALPYYSHRRMLIIPDSQMYLHEDLVERNLELIAGDSVPLLIVKGNTPDQLRWTEKRIGQLKLWSKPLFTHGDVSAFARRDRYEGMHRKLAATAGLVLTLGEAAWMLPREQRIQLAGTEAGTEMGVRLGTEPIWGVLPYGIQLIDDTKPAVLAHATTELCFPLPPAARTVTLEYVVNPQSYEAAGFDGLAVLVDQIDGDENRASLHFDWMSPHPETHRERTVTLSLPEGSTGGLLVRVMPGPGGNNAYDQLWLRTVRFE